MKHVEGEFKSVSYGNIASPDCLVYIFSYLEFSELLRVRNVCSSWKDIASSNVIWKRWFIEHFADDIEDLNRRFLESKAKKFWFYEYNQALKEIPSMITESTFVKDHPDEIDEYVGYEGYYNDRDDDLVYFIQSLENPVLKRDHTIFQFETLHDDVSYETHRLAVILALFSVNKYKQSLRSPIRIGYENDYKEIPLSKFCYAILHDKDKSLFPIKDEDRFNKLQVASEEREEGDEYPNKDIYDLESASICPTIEEVFVPFVEYLFATGTKSDYNLKKMEPLYYGQEDITSIYFWKSSRNGWAPGFFNASFSWFYTLLMASCYYSKQQVLVVSKIVNRDPVF